MKRDFITTVFGHDNNNNDNNDIITFDHFQPILSIKGKQIIAWAIAFLEIFKQSEQAF